MTTIDEIIGLVDDALFLRLTIDQVDIRAKITKAIAEARAEGAREMRQAVLLTDERLDALADEVFDLIQDETDDDVGDMTWDRMFGRAIEAAVLAANGLTK